MPCVDYCYMFWFLPFRMQINAFNFSIKIHVNVYVGLIFENFHYQLHLPIFVINDLYLQREFEYQQI